MVLLNCSWEPCWCVQLETFLRIRSTHGETLSYAGANVLGRANAWSENAVPEGRQANGMSAFAKQTKKRISRYLQKKIGPFGSIFLWRYLADSNRRTRFCRPIPSRSVKVPFAFAVAKVTIFLIPPILLPIFIPKISTENKFAAICRCGDWLGAVNLARQYHGGELVEQQSLQGTLYGTCTELRIKACT